MTYDFSLHEDKTRSGAVPESWLHWHLSLIWPTQPVVVIRLVGDSDNTGCITADDTGISKGNLGKNIGYQA